MKKIIYGLVIALAVLHQDFWWWDNKSLVLGFIPLGLFYHSVFSCVAALVWFGATKFAWPSEIEAWAESSSSEDSAEGGDQ